MARRHPGARCAPLTAGQIGAPRVAPDTDDPNPPPGGMLRRTQMLDIAMLALTFGFFIAGILYVLGCERL
ncbi:MAG TPA: hypothetical protein VMB81_27015 [Candidatus Sulfotelmatobacter sp.]|nr:hypothetical protein [Candidatus Sulfotelmatobacter sp.]